MFLPHHHRALSLVVFGWVAWQFLSLGVVMAAGSVVLTFQSRMEVVVLAPLALGFLHVGVMAIERIRAAANGPLAR